MTIDILSATHFGNHSARPLAAAAPAQSGASGETAKVTAVAADGKEDLPTYEQLTRAVSELNKSPQATAQGLEFSIDSDTQRTVVKVIDQSTREVLRQIPTPEALDIAKALEAKTTKGVLIQQTA